MRYLKTYRVFESAGPGLTPEQEKFLNKYTEGRWKYNPATGLVDVEGDFDCSSERLKTLSGVKFGKVSGYFYCQRNKLTSLEGAPQEVGGDFDCSNNQLTSLEGAPQEVGRNFYCSYNQLTSLEGAPQEVGVDFYCQRNKLTSLEGAPQEVGRNFYCSGNKLTSLEGAPREVGGYFDCSKNKLSTLEGAPDKIGGDFFCDVFHLGEGGWNPEGWLEILKNGKSEAQSLILTILTPEELNREIQKDPAGMIMKLKPAWNDESFRETRDQLIWPQGYEEEMEIVGGLNTIGF
jgi:hypothetical protein